MNLLGHIFRRVAEYGYRWQGSPFSVTAEGSVHPHGFFGSYLEKTDRKRVIELMDKIRAVPPRGAALDDYARESLYGIYVTRLRDGAAARYSLRGKVEIEANYSDAFLLSCLPHEFRHARQHDVIRKLMHTDHLPPDAGLVINRFLEADAFLFGQKFCEDYAAHTGDRRPLKSFLARSEIGLPGITKQLESAQTDQARFLVWNSSLAGARSFYDPREIDFLTSVSQDRAGAPWQKHMIAPEVADKLIVAVARQIDTDWPLSSGGHYLSGLSDAELTSPDVKRLPTDENFHLLMKIYKRDYAAKHAAPAKKAGAPSVL